MRDETVLLPSGPYRLSTRVVGAGPLVILMHGWPELGLSWRHQIQPLAAAGFTVAAPDMRGYGRSSKPDDVRAYGLNVLADDMANIATALGHQRWVSIGHDWGAPVAWRTALRFPGRVAAVFALSVPFSPPSPIPALQAFDLGFPDRFFYMRYFQKVGVAEAELERDVRASLKRIFHSLSGDAPKDDWLGPRPIDGPMLPGLSPSPEGPLSFMSDDELDDYAAAYEAGGFFAPICWYRNLDTDFVERQGYGDAIIRQPAGLLYGDKEIVLSMLAPNALENMRKHVIDLRTHVVLPGAGHWIQQERPAEVNAALLDFLGQVRPLI